MRKNLIVNRSSWRAALAFVTLLALAACGAAELVVQGVTIDASTTTAAVGATVDLEATVAYTGGDPLDPPESVTWSVDPTAGVTLTQTSSLEATFVATTPGVYTVTATNGWDPTKSGSIEITVTTTGGSEPEVVSVAVTADAERVAPDDDATITANVTVLNGASSAVTWSVSPAANTTLTPVGSTATFSASTIGTYTITATSVDDATKSDSVEVLVEIATRINSGGAEYVALDGRVFVADAFFTDGIVYPAADQTDLPIRTANIAGTNDDEMYRSERGVNGFAMQTVFTYAIPVPLNGEYQVVLHFAELFYGVDGGAPGNDEVGNRIFDVSLEETLVLDNFDLRVIDLPATAISRSFDITVNDGFVDLTFTNVVENAKVNAIEVVYVGP